MCLCVNVERSGCFRADLAGCSFPANAICLCSCPLADSALAGMMWSESSSNHHEGAGRCSPALSLPLVCGTWPLAFASPQGCQDRQAGGLPAWDFYIFPPPSKCHQLVQVTASGCPPADSVLTGMVRSENSTCCCVGERVKSGPFAKSQ